MLALGRLTEAVSGALPLLDMPWHLCGCAAMWRDITDMAEDSHAAADLEDEESRRGTQRRKRANRRRYGPRKAREFSPMDNFEVPAASCQPAAKPASVHLVQCLPAFSDLIGMP